MKGTLILDSRRQQKSNSRRGGGETVAERGMIQKGKDCDCVDVD